MYRRPLNYASDTFDDTHILAAKFGIDELLIDQIKKRIPNLSANQKVEYLYLLKNMNQEIRSQITKSLGELLSKVILLRDKADETKNDQITNIKLLPRTLFDEPGQVNTAHINTTHINTTYAARAAHVIQPTIQQTHTDYMSFPPGFMQIDPLINEPVNPPIDIRSHMPVDAHHEHVNAGLRDNTVRKNINLSPNFTSGEPNFFLNNYNTRPRGKWQAKEQMIRLNQSQTKNG